MVRGRTEIALHHFSNTLNRLRGDDSQMWLRSRKVPWRGVFLQLPSAADTLLMTIIHGIRWSDQSNADWAIDASALIASGDIDWQILVEDARSRRVEAIAASGLIYLADELGSTVDPAVLETLCGTINASGLDELSRYAAMAEPITAEDDASAFTMARLRNGDTGPLPTPEALEARGPRLAWRQLGVPTAERHEKMFRVPDDEGEFLLLNIQLFVEDAQNLPHYDFTAGIKGLTFFRTRPFFSALQGGGAVADIKAVLPLGLLRERQAKHFVLRYESAVGAGTGSEDAALNVICLVV